MKRLYLLLLIPFLLGAAPSRVKTYVAGTTIVAGDVTANEDEMFNYLQAGVDTYKALSIDNDDISATAAISDTKLNLATIAQNIQFNGTSTFAGNITFASQTIADLGTVTTGIFTEVDINSGGIDNTIIGGTTRSVGYFSEMDATTANIDAGTWQGTIDGNWTAASQTCADIGTVTTGVLTAVDIQSGGIDNVIIGATSPNIGNFSESTVVTTTITSGTVTTLVPTTIALVNPVTEFSTDGSLAGNSDTVIPTEKATKTYVDQKPASNVLFNWSGVDNVTANQNGMYVGTDGSIDVEAGAMNYVYLAADKDAAQQMMSGQFVKTDAIDTATIHAKMSTQGGQTCTATVDIGGQSNTVTRANNATAAWVTTTDIDVSGLTGVNDITISLTSSMDGQDCYIWAIMLQGS